MKKYEYLHLKETAKINCNAIFVTNKVHEMSILYVPCWVTETESFAERKCRLRVLETKMLHLFQIKFWKTSSYLEHTFQD